MSNQVGSVTAKIILDTEEFEKAVEKLKGEVEEIKGAFSKKTSGKGLTSEVSKLKKEIESLQGKTEDYKKTIKNLREQNADYAKGIENLNNMVEKLKKGHADFNKELLTEQKNLDNTNKSAREYVKLADKMTKQNTQYLKYRPAGESKLRGDIFKITQGGGGVGGVRSKYADFSYWTKLKNTGKVSIGTVKKSFETLTDTELKWQSNLTNAINKARDGMKQYDRQVKESIATEQRKWSQTGGITGYINLINQMRQAMNRVNNSTKVIKNIDEPFRAVQGRLKEMTTFFKITFKETADGIEVIKTPIGRVSEVLSTFNFKLVELANNSGVATEKAIQLASAMQRMNTQGTGSWQGRQTTGGYSNYISSITKINQELTRQAELEAQVKQQKMDQYYAKVGAAATKYWNQIRQGTITLNTYKGNISQINKEVKKQAQAAKEAKLATEGLSQAYSKINLNSYKSNINQINKSLEQQRLRTLQVEAAQASLYNKLAPNNLQTYKMNMDKINQSLEKQVTTHQKNNNELKRGQMSMREFGTSMGKAEAYSNNLYRGLQKVRSVIVSFKTIMGAMGGMALWGFATDLIEGAKETYKAKSEMESLLTKNKNVDPDGINTFNKALDETINKFQKINKYSLGETATSIGLEFDLNAKEMADSLEVIAMVQSEYARAGRTSEEAALAVKDILQGEFRRLSMETGIGKEDLIEKYGWNGKKEDVQDLMEALRKAGKDRHWDVFAAKATSLNDIINITKSRFSELGADLITNVEPMIVGAFNGIMTAIDSVKGHFDSLGSFGKISTIAGVGGGAFVGISTALMMLKRNIGLVDIATLGWGKSFATALMGLNKTEVAMYGFRKTLLATISGTNAATVANTGFGKSLLTKILNLNHATVAEKGLSTAIMERSLSLRGVTLLTDSAGVSTLKWYQKIGVATGGLDLATAKSASFTKSLRAMISVTKILKIAVLGITTIAIAAWFASVAAAADRAKKAMDNFNHINSEGSDIAKSAGKKVDSLKQKLDGLTKGTKEYRKVAKRLKIATANKEDIDNANKLLKVHKKQYKAQKESINANKEARWEESLKLASDGKKTPSLTSYENQMQTAIDVRNKALAEYDNRLYKASQHVNEQVKNMKEAGVSEEKRLSYVREYNAESEQTAKLWKKFSEGDINSGFYAILSEVKLLWIDLWNNEHFVNFWKSVNNTWRELKPTVDWLKNTLGDIGNLLLDFFATKQGQIVGGIALVGLAFGGIAYKLRGVFGTVKDTVGGLKNLTKWFKKSGDEGKKANGKLGGDKSTGGITGNTTTSTKTPFKKQILGDVKNYARAAVGIAAGMLLISEAIIMLQAPMGALAATGWVFEQLEPNIRKGIKGLTLVAPTVMALLPPVIALSYVFGKYGVEAGTIMQGAGRAAVGIAAGMLLVAEAVVMMNAPLLAIASVGYTFNWQKDAVLKGKEALQLVTDCLVSLAPTIPLFIGGIALMATVLAAPEIGIPALGATALGIGVSMLLVAEAVMSLNMPLAAIAQTGQNYPDLTNVQQGAKALKITATALGYVEEAVDSFVGITWSSLKEGIANLVAQILDIDLTQLTGEGGFFEQINTFIGDFNTKVDIKPIDTAKVETLGASADGISSIGTAMDKVKTAMDNIPDEFKNGGATGNVLTNYDPKTGKPKDSNASVDVEGYFDTFKEPIRQLKDFIYDFNNNDEFAIEQIDTTRVSNLSSAADMIVTVNDAVTKVKTTMQNIGESGSATAFAEGGWFGQLGYNIFHMSGAGAMNNGQSSGEYKSSLGSQLKEMEDVVSDLFTFSNNISQYGGSEGEGADVGGIANMVTIISEAINNVSTTLSNAVPTFTGHGNDLSSALVNGFKNNLHFPNVPALIANKIMNTKETLYATANALGLTTARKFKTGADPMSDMMGWELYYVNEKLTGEWYDKIGTSAYNLGQHASNKYKEGLDMNSPGIMARATSDEMGFIGDAFSQGITNLPQMAMNLGNALSNNFNLDFNLSNIQLPDLSGWASNLQSVVPTVSGVKTQVSTNFENMKASVQGSFTNILTKTRTSLNNMKTATTKNIGGIKTSWKGMQDALIASADHIKTQTSSKINTLKTNLGKFWNKLKHPDQLIQSGAAGGHTGSRKRHFVARTPKLFAGNNDKTPSIKTDFDEYMKCLMSGSNCYAGGWNFNWNKKIQGKFNGWDTHFGKWNLDSHLKVGKFSNTSSPIQALSTGARAAIAKSYIFDTIAATKYDKYFNSNFGENPVAALLAGAFNCWDGTNIVLSIAKAFGFIGSRGHGTWNGIGHVWADIPGLGIIDPTAIQQNGSFTSSSVKGYHAGSIKRGRKGDVPPSNNPSQHNEVHIHIEGPVYGVDDLNKKIEDGAKRVARGLFKNSYSGV